MNQIIYLTLCGLMFFTCGLCDEQSTKQELESLQTTVKELIAKQNGLSQEIQMLKTNQMRTNAMYGKTLYELHNKMEDGLGKLFNQTNSTSAFYASLTSDRAGLGIGQPVVFDKVWYNKGEYSNSTGMFLCPLTGVYAFVITAANCVDQDFIELDLTVEGVSVAKVYSGDGAAGIRTGSKTAVVLCNQFQEIQVMYMSGTNCLGGSHQSTFSGFHL